MTVLYGEAVAYVPVFNFAFDAPVRDRFVVLEATRACCPSKMKGGLAFAYSRTGYFEIEMNGLSERFTWKMMRCLETQVRQRWFKNNERDTEVALIRDSSQVGELGGRFQ